jgi:hypothetical protein
LKVVEKNIKLYNNINKKIEKNNSSTFTKNILAKYNIKNINKTIEQQNMLLTLYKESNNILVGGSNNYGDGSFDLCIDQNKNILMQLGPSLENIFRLAYFAGIKNEIMNLKI